MNAAAAVSAHEVGLDRERELEAEIGDLVVREEEAVAEAVATNPRESAYKSGSKAAKLRQQRLAAEASLGDLRQFELPARAHVALQAQRDEAKRRLAAAVAEARGFDAAEADALERAAAAFAGFVAAWSDLEKAASAREQIGVALRQAGDLGSTEVEVAEALRAFTSTVRPFPASPGVLFDSCVFAGSDEHADTDYFRSTHPDAAQLVELLRATRDAGLYYRASGLELSEVRRELRSPDLTVRARASKVAIVSRQAA